MDLRGKVYEAETVIDKCRVIGECTSDIEFDYVRHHLGVTDRYSYITAIDFYDLYLEFGPRCINMKNILNLYIIPSKYWNSQFISFTCYNVFVEPFLISFDDDYIHMMNNSCGFTLNRDTETINGFFYRHHSYSPGVHHYLMSFHYRDILGAFNRQEEIFR